MALSLRKVGKGGFRFSVTKFEPVIQTEVGVSKYKRIGICAFITSCSYACDYKISASIPT